jgi:hypothetical protein
MSSLMRDTHVPHIMGWKIHRKSSDEIRGGDCGIRFHPLTLIITLLEVFVFIYFPEFGEMYLLCFPYAWNS